MFVLQVVWLCGMGTGGRRYRVTFGEPRRWEDWNFWTSCVLDTQAGPDIPGTLTQEYPGQPDSWEFLRPQRAKNSCYHNHPLELSDSDDVICKFLAV
ncbi:hypothetical protein [Paenibacillus sp. B2(2019)]|uniref:hypothetical protein n=1 Tax=Paenibacillus sp. B2(2019) TaxID=2607754 RepID=UPI0011F393AF|nr:hypothetical protein [Paenibacillus sp. B2(2019)]KAA1181755.1 hypothetical protein PAENI_23640 [Paenibacillus sp. B2(2019)]